MFNLFRALASAAFFLPALDAMLDPALEAGGAANFLGQQELCPPLQPGSRAKEQAAAVQGLIARLLPGFEHLFSVEVHLPGAAESPCGSRSHPSCNSSSAAAAWYHVSCDGKGVQVTGSSGVEAAAGLHTFLKERCGACITWAATGGTHVPTAHLATEGLQRLAALPPVEGTRAVPLQLYQNVVTSSYSMTWWDWARWEQEIDWMALQGINLPLAFTGQELIWARVYERYGIQPSDLGDFFSGPAFLAWQRMGNLQGYGGPLPLSFMERQAALQLRIVARMRSFGMAPVLPAFAGFVPAALVRKAPHARFTRATRWGGFPGQFCCPYMLDPLDPLFQELGAAFVREQRAAYGWEPEGAPSYYAADTFNEMRPLSSAPEYLASVSGAVYRAMSAGDPGAVWLMQAWLFFSDQAFWGPAEIKALLGGVPRDRLIMLDLFPEAHPQWSRTDSFGGVPFIWCMLGNFGGNSDMYGALPAAVEGFWHALSSGSSVVGLGLAPEGIETNPVTYDLVSELSFRPEPIELAGWFASYVRRRYGQDTPSEAVRAWQLLRETVYDCRDGHPNTVMDVPTSRPGMSRAEIGLWGLHPRLWYDPSKPLAAWRLLTECAGAGGQGGQGGGGAGGDGEGGVERGERDEQQEEEEEGEGEGEAQGSLQGGLAGGSGYRYDLVDLGRSVLSKHSTQLWWGMVVGCYNRDASQVAAAGAQLLELLDDMDSLLATHPGFLLGPRVAKARAAGGTPEEADLHERNLRAQITHWGVGAGGDSEIHDYASKMWSGLVGGYYRERWAQWLAWLLRELAEGRPYDAAGWRNHTVQHALAWAQAVRTPFPQEPRGDPVAISKALLAKYFPCQPRTPGAAAVAAVAVMAE